MSTNPEDEKTLESGGENPPGKRRRHFRGYWNMENTQVWVEMYVKMRMSAQAIAKEEDADASTISSWLRKHGLEIHQGEHRIMRKPPKISPELVEMLVKGPEEVLRLIHERVWGIAASVDGLEQLTNFCRFLVLPLEVGAEDVAEKLTINRDTVRKWTLGIDQPYLVRVADVATHATPMQLHKLLPMRLSAGGNLQSGWIQVPIAIRNKDDIATILKQIEPLERTFERAEKIGISKEAVR